MNYEDLEARIARLERKSDYWDIAGFIAIGLVFLGIWEIIKWVYGLFF